jgi:hypothetical protein
MAWCLKKKKGKKKSQGVSLMEISIGLVVTSLLITGASVGKTMISQAELLKIIGEIKTVETSLAQYQLRYSYLPGDDPKAGRIWSGANSGNGNGVIGDLPLESYYLWEHLYRAGFESNAYSGTNTEIKSSFFRDGAYVVGNQGNASIFGKSADYVLKLGAKSTNVGGESDANFSLFTPEEMAFIDIKMDDGIPSRGNIFGTNGNNIVDPLNCSSDGASSGNKADGTPVEYNFAYTGKSCRLFYWFK